MYRKLLYINSNCIKSSARLSFPFLKSAQYVNDVNGKEATIQSLCNRWVQRYREHKIPDPECSAQLIIAHAMGKKMLHEVPENTEINEDCRKRIEELCSQRLERKPVQYIIGEWDFIDITLKMRPPVLIPRPETEELCELILRDLVSTRINTQPINLLDIGCGSGAISMYLLKHLTKARCVAVDKSIEACDLTLENASRLRMSDRIIVLHEDITKDDILMKLPYKGAFDVIISNPPYISTVDMETLMPEVKRFESQEALHGGCDGLDIVRRILQLSGELLKTEGALWFESDVGHPSKIRDIVEKHMDLKLVFAGMMTDLAKRERFCKLRRTNEDSEKHV